MSKAERIHQAIARTIGTAILSGTYQLGDGFEGEIEQSLALGVSRTPYREANRIFVTKGLLESRSRAGTRVTPRNRWNLLDPDVLALTFSGEPDEKFVHSLFELRGIIEGSRIARRDVVFTTRVVDDGIAMPPPRARQTAPVGSPTAPNRPLTEAVGDIPMLS